MIAIAVLIIALGYIVYVDSQLCNVSEAEYKGLYSLFQSLNGLNWTQSTGWRFPSTVSDPCSNPSWFGLTCLFNPPSNCSVIEIVLSSNRLFGELPEMTSFSSLQSLDLSNNMIVNTIPSSLGSLSYIINYDLSYNDFSGYVPVSFTQLSTLQNLNLENNLNLNGTILSLVCRNQNLVNLSLSNNRFSGTIPSCLASLSALQSIDIQFNRVTGSIPTSIGLTNSLLTLNVANNKLTGTIPAQIVFVSSLQQLVLESNSLWGKIPTLIGNLTNLFNLAVNTNSLSGTIPPSIGNISSLIYLHLATNKFHGSIPNEICNCFNLIELNLPTNKLTGTIPTSIGNFRYLQSLNLAANILTGTLPSQLGNVTTLKYMTMANNKIRGMLGEWVCTMTSLTYLYLNANSLSGPILPNCISALSNLTTLGLYNIPHVTGTIPVGVGNLTRLTNILLASPNLTPVEFPEQLLQLTNLLYFTLNGPFYGPIPEEFGIKLAKLKTINIGASLWTQSIPTTIGLLTDMTAMIIGSPYIEGTIPTELGLLKSLTNFMIRGTPVTGSIPSQLFNISTIQYMSLNNDHLSGSIPAAISRWTSLYNIYLENNKFTGPLPLKYLNNITTLHYLNFGNNSFTGTIPSVLKGLESIQLLNISQNLISGTIPEAIGDLKNMEYLYLAANNLHGTIPSSVGSMQALNTLDIASNSLKGTIPSELFNIASIEGLLLSDNLLSGSLVIPRVFCMELLNLANNSLTGAIPRSLFQPSNCTAASYDGFEFLFLSNNSFTSLETNTLGPLLSTIDLSYNSIASAFPENLGNVSFFSVQSNSFSGEFRVNCSYSNYVKYLFVGNNNFDGGLSNVSCLPAIQTLSAEYNYFTRDLSFMAQIGSTIGEVILFNNLLSQSLPSDIASITSLQLLLLQNNLFTGNPNNIFNNLTQTVLTAVDISSNDFTGLIPSSVFHLPNLGAFSANDNCFAGSLPSTLCECTSLKVLQMNGVTSGQFCRRYIKAVKSSEAYMSTVGVLDGGIPSCLWKLPSLVSLHLSSNGITGSLISPTNSSNLTTLVLSNNMISGTIPLSLQQLPFHTLDLSNNRLKGTYSQPLYHADASISLINNRLSGYITALYNGTYVNVLEGNLFNCDENHPKPLNDHSRGVTSCGSNQLDLSLVTFAVCWLVCLIATIVVWPQWRKSFSVKSHLADLNDYGKSFLEAILFYPAIFIMVITSSLGHEANNGQLLDTIVSNVSAALTNGTCSFLYVFISMVTLISSYALAIVGFSLLLIPIFLGLKFSDDKAYSTHTYQYSWLPSAAFFSGIAPAAILLFAWSLVVLVSIYFFYRSRCLEAIVKRSADERDSMFQSSRATKLQYVTIVVIHSVIIGIVNVMYLIVFLSSSYTVLQKTAVQIAVSLFKSLWNGLVVSRAISTVENVDKNGNRNETMSTPILVQFCCLVISSVLAPFVASLVSNSLCFLDLFIPESAISENFFYSLATREACFSTSTSQYQSNTSNPYNFDDDLGLGSFHPKAPSQVQTCVQYGSISNIITDFYPPFTYSYQCGSSILTSYIPVLIYTYAFQILQVFLFSFLTRLNSNDVEESLADETLPDILCQDLVTDSKSVSLSMSVYSSNKGLTTSNNVDKETKGTASDKVLTVRSKIWVFISSQFSGIYNPRITTKTGSQLIGASSKIAALMNYVLVLLTFGLVSPILSIIIGLTLVWELRHLNYQLSTYLSNNPKCASYFPDPEKKGPDVGNVVNADGTGGLNAACNVNWDVAMRCLWISSFVSAVFWSLLIFDILGDSMSKSSARYVPLTVALLVLGFVPVVYCAYKLAFLWSRNQLPSSQNGEQSPSMRIAASISLKSLFPVKEKVGDTTSSTEAVSSAKTGISSQVSYPSMELHDNMFSDHNPIHSTA